MNGRFLLVESGHCCSCDEELLQFLHAAGDVYRLSICRILQHQANHTEWDSRSAAKVAYPIESTQILG